MVASKYKKGFVPDNTKASETLSGKNIYNNYCQSCHGDDGNKGLSGAKDLSASMLTKKESYSVIYNGRNNMMAYKNQLSKEQIDSVNNYIQILKK